MKRLVVCCDGTWNRSTSVYITNIEKIARTVETDMADGVQQLVQYVGGVGTSWSRVDRLLGGMFGFGLFDNVIVAYRFLALNYQPGDEIFIFGFSRGAYTARSLAGMLTSVGLLTREMLIANGLSGATNRYRNKPPKGGDFGSHTAEFKRDYCHTDVRITFLGVFDTVGALGIPGHIFRKRHNFHNVQLSPDVSCARHALAIDDRRITFQPTLWELGPRDTPGRVKQVWFEGVHSDIGGGAYPESGLSDTTLLWMVHEANLRGLAFNQALLGHYLDQGSEAVRHDSMNLKYRALNAIGRLNNWRNDNERFIKNIRRLDSDKGRVSIASSAVDHFDADEGYSAPNIGWFKEAKGGRWRKSYVEGVIAMPEPPGTLVEVLSAHDVDLEKANLQKPLTDQLLTWSERAQPPS